MNSSKTIKTYTVLMYFLISILLIGCGARKISAPISDSAPAPDIYSGSKEETIKRKSKARQQDLSPETPNYYEVKKGDTLYSIAVQFGLDYNHLAELNKINDSNVINVGQKLKLRLDTIAGDKGRNAIQADTPQDVAVRDRAERKPVEKEEEKKKEEFKNDWRWPVDGTLIYRFSENVNKNGKGIGIRVKGETPVFSSAPGKVVYSGNGLRGYGNLLIIKHGDNFLSVYAHNTQLLASESQFVAQGQQVAIIDGSKGDDILHFEIRLKGKPVDPLKHLPKR